jgi:hypothetical protein
MTTTIPSPVYFTLEPTATYSRRRIGWFPAAFAADRLGTLRVVLELEGRSKDACEVDCYAVDEVEPRLSQIRTFLLLNETDAEQEQPYEVTTVSGVVVKCTCRAGKCRIPDCKHSSAIQRLLSEGLL